MHGATFGVTDYVIFCVTLCFSSAIGVYFGCFGTKQNTESEYLYGNRRMNAIPVGLSLYSSAVSALTIVGTPPEVYVFGTQFLLITVGQVLSLIITWTFILPVFCGKLHLKTPYEYFERRFGSEVRTMSSIIYIIHTVLFLPIVLYAATLPFSEVTGISTAFCTSIVGGVCVFYTMLGGFSSVIWTDTLQATLMLGSCIFVLVTGTNAVGGLDVVWNRADAGGRITFFNFDPNPLQRTTVWTTVIGMCFNSASHTGCSAGTIQRYMSLKNESQARISTLIGVVGMAITSAIAGMIGLCMYAFYQGCDPVKNQDVSEPNKILPYFIGDIVGDINGFSGFFIAGILSAGLSTISSELNTVSGIIYHDFIKKYSDKEYTDAQGAFVMKIIVLVNGCIYLGIAPWIQKSQYIIQCAMIIVGLTYGAKLGIMLLGTTFPKANTKGVIAGTICSLLIVSWISMGSFYYNIGSSFSLPTTVSNCTTPNNATLSITSSTTNEPLFIYKISFLYFPLIGTFITVFVGLLISYVTGPNDITKLDTNLLIPYFRKNDMNDEMY